MPFPFIITILNSSHSIMIMFVILVVALFTVLFSKSDKSRDKSEMRARTLPPFAAADSPIAASTRNGDSFEYNVYWHIRHT